MRQSWADLRKAATRRLRSPARVASTTWLGSTPYSGTVVTSMVRVANCGDACNVSPGTDRRKAGRVSRPSDASRGDGRAFRFASPSQVGSELRAAGYLADE